jgi:hypothetical protein
MEPAPARLLQRVMLALPLRPDILRTAFLPSASSTTPSAAAHGPVRSPPAGPRHRTWSPAAPTGRRTRPPGHRCPGGPCPGASRPPKRPDPTTPRCPPPRPARSHPHHPGTPPGADPITPGRPAPSPPRRAQAQAQAQAREAPGRVGRYAGRPVITPADHTRRHGPLPSAGLSQISARCAQAAGGGTGHLTGGGGMMGRLDTC